MKLEQMKIVIVGHVDHGKSTVIGRLLSDTGSLPEGKLQEVKDRCAKNAKPFEYAFLLDALKDEQSQGITIDSARCFFKTQKRHYIVFDAPGHIEFLKNMVTGAAHAEAALLVIDANEGIQENSKRHGYLLSFLGIKQVSVLVNKMDLVNYDKQVFESIKKEYTEFLNHINVRPDAFVPISAMEGEGIINFSEKMKWYKGKSTLDQLDTFEKEKQVDDKPFRFPVQDIYKFTEEGDDRRIIAGTIESGSISKGDDVVFLPSKKESTIKSVESFNTQTKTSASAPEAIGFTLKEQIYINPGEIMVKKNEAVPHVSSRIKVNIFWMGRAPLIKNKAYKLKIATQRMGVKLVDVLNVIDALELKTVAKKEQVDRYDVAEIILETSKPIAFDLIDQIAGTSRFVLVDNYEIAGGGIVVEGLSDAHTLLEEHVIKREQVWEKGGVGLDEKIVRNKHKPKFIVFCGEEIDQKIQAARLLERRLFENKHQVYYLGLSNVLYGLDSDRISEFEDMDEHIRRLGELARIVTDSGQIFITILSAIDDYDIEKLKILTVPNDFITVLVGENIFNTFVPDLSFDGNNNAQSIANSVYDLLEQKEIIAIEYNI
ncbi:MAG: Sulfate adenylyltransferase, large subunit [Candidatus Uhrbacteria bacterium GW2011_GWF2_41_16]|uniref:sulfate adenylyltransferase n=1 Tax=Candidatus Uhrbacteria bacterium GW2011_GWF2_41_16 TaxID=1618997 RepID=A0A0G0Y8M2_9BACT|nr:MAG: Sulfate adenylyltransferase, large subunit [Candidatus Uhrbacteria bacterium GW2011_GWF2_41_16]